MADSWGDAEGNREEHLLAVIVPVLEGRDSPFPRLSQSLSRQSMANFTVILVGPDVAVPDNGEGGIARVQAEGTLAACIDAAIASTSATYVMVAEGDGEFVLAGVKALREALAADPFDTIYGDELVERGRSQIVLAKPDYSPERLRCQNYYGNAVFYRTDFLRAMGGVDAGLPGAEMYDLALRSARSGAKVGHVRESLFLLPEGAPKFGSLSSSIELKSTRRALSEHLSMTGGGSVEMVSETGVHRTHRTVVGDPLVSIVIPSRGSFGKVRGEERSLVVECVRSILEKSTYLNFELLVVLDTVGDEKSLAMLRSIEDDRVRIVYWNRPFSFSEKVNFGVFASRGDFVLFLNDDTEVISPGWIEPMLALCQMKNAGMAGAMLYFEDDSIQHAGHLYLGGSAGHAGTNDNRGSAGPLSSYLVEREVSGVTAACSLMPRSVFDQVGGFSPLLPGNFNDVDLCMKVGQLGFNIYWTPNSELYHYESKSRQPRVARYEREIAWNRWEWKLDDPTYWPYGSAVTLE